MAQQRRFSVEYKREAVAMLESPDVSIRQIIRHVAACDAFLESVRRFDFDQFRFFPYRSRDLLRHGGTRIAWQDLDLDRPAIFCGSGERLDDGDVDGAFRSGRLWLLAVENAIREVDEQRRELVALRELARGSSLVERQPMRKLGGIAVSRRYLEVALGADHLVPARVRGPEAARECREAAVRKAHHGAHHFVDHGEAFVGTACDRREHFDGLCAKQIPCGVDAIDADIVERPAAQFLVEPDVLGSGLHRELRIENPGLADLA